MDRGFGNLKDRIYGICLLVLEVLAEDNLQGEKKAFFNKLLSGLNKSLSTNRSSHVAAKKDS